MKNEELPRWRMGSVLISIFLLAGCLTIPYGEYYGISVQILLEEELENDDPNLFSSITYSDLATCPTLLKAVNQLIDNLTSNDERTID